MPRHSVHDMEIDEVSLVDRPANQHAAVMIAKAAPRGDGMPQAQEETEYFWADGSPVEEFDTDDMPVGAVDGDVITDSEGNQFKVVIEGDETDAAEAEAEGELVGAGIGKAFGRRPAPIEKSLTQTLAEELSKAVGDRGTRNALSKAMEYVEAADQRAEAAITIAKREQDLRLDREFIEKAASYGALPVEAGVLGPVLKRCAQLLPEADCVILNKVFESTGEILFSELGMTGGGEALGDDPMAIAKAHVEAQLAGKSSVSKNADGETVTLSKEAGTVQYFSDNPAAYDEYMAGRR